MADTRKIIKVFLASPGDLTDERRTAKVVVDEFNSLWAGDFGYQVELIGWEDTVTVFGRPQAIINRELERCELFVGLMWRKWGTAPATSGPYSSGFEEEFDASVRRRVREGRPEISLFFKEIAPEFLVDPGKDLKRVLAFKEKLVAEKEILFEGFSDIQDFERKVRRCISNYVRQLRIREVDAASVKNQAPTTGGEKQQLADASKSVREGPLSNEGARFLRALITKSESEGGGDAIQAVEVARFRLLASLVGKRGNDERLLGVHDANLFLTKGDQFTLGDIELAGLISTGLRNFSNGNAPLWRWVKRLGGASDTLLAHFSLFTTDAKRRVGAIAAMRLISAPLASGERNSYLNSWLDEEAPSEVKVAALGYLGEWGIPSDIPAIRKVFDRNDNQSVNAAAEALVQIYLRESLQKGIAALYELQPSSVSRKTLEKLFQGGTAISDELLMSGVNHRNAQVRHIVVQLLRRKRTLVVETAEKLLSDDDPHVRYEALMSLVDGGRSFSDEEARGILRKPGRGLGAFFALGSYDHESERNFEKFRGHRLASLKDKELQDAVSEDSIFDRDVEFARVERHFAIHGGELKEQIANRFAKTFAKELDAMVQRLGASGAETIEKTKKLEEFTRKNHTRRGLDIVCQQFNPADITLVRNVLRSGYVDYSSADIEYLRRFGEWDDIQLIIDAVKRPEFGRHPSLLGGASDDAKYREASRAIYYLGRNRMKEIIVLDMPGEVLAYQIAESPLRAFRALTDAGVMRLLNSEDEKVRKAASLKCVRVFSHARIGKLLAEYFADDKRHFYNVIHWLDFGVSTSREQAISAAERTLRNEWPA